MRRRASHTSLHEGETTSGSPATSGVTATKRDDVLPVCPQCDVELEEIYVRKMRRGPFGIGRGFVMFCPHCRKVLGHGTQWYPFPG